MFDFSPVSPDTDQCRRWQNETFEVYIPEDQRIFIPHHFFYQNYSVMKKLFFSNPFMLMGKTKLITLLSAISFFLICENISGQFIPVPITGFNHDVVAESGTSSLTTTTICLDGVTQSNKVMYNVTFRNANAFEGGGIPDNDTISD